MLGIKSCKASKWDRTLQTTDDCFQPYLKKGSMNASKWQVLKLHWRSMRQAHDTHFTTMPLWNSCPFSNNLFFNSRYGFSFYKAAPCQFLHEKLPHFLTGDLGSCLFSGQLHSDSLLRCCTGCFTGHTSCLFCQTSIPLLGNTTWDLLKTGFFGFLKVIFISDSLWGRDHKDFFSICFPASFARKPISPQFWRSVWRKDVPKSTCRFESVPFLGKKDTMES